ncbi:flagellar motor switch phosphatase FliY [Cytobacillus sp. Hm23]
MVSDDMLSQDEIEALLNGTVDLTSEEEDQTPPVEQFLSTIEQDALGEIGNISFGSSATALSTLLNNKVEITTPTVSVVLKRKLEEEFPQPYVAIQVNYTAGFSGANLLVIKKHDAAVISDIMLGGDGLNPNEEIGDLQLSAVQEAMNQMMGSAATSMSTIFNKKVDISPPSIDILDIKEGNGTNKIPEDDSLIKISFKLKIGEIIDSSIMQLLPVSFAKELVKGLLEPEQNEMSHPSSNTQNDSSAVTQAAHHAELQGSPMHQTAKEVAATAVMEGVGQAVRDRTTPQYIGAGVNRSSQMQPTNVQPAVFSNFEPVHLTEAESSNLDMLLDIPLKVTVELGRTKRTVKEILDMSSGSIIELDKLAGEPVDILINQKKIAQGEVVVIEENFGVRVTDIVSQTDRINKMR